VFGDGRTWRVNKREEGKVDLFTITHTIPTTQMRFCVFHKFGTITLRKVMNSEKKKENPNQAKLVGSWKGDTQKNSLKKGGENKWEKGELHLTSAKVWEGRENLRRKR